MSELTEAPESEPSPPPPVVVGTVPAAAPVDGDNNPVLAPPAGDANANRTRTGSGVSSGSSTTTSSSQVKTASETVAVPEGDDTTLCHPGPNGNICTET